MNRMCLVVLLQSVAAYVLEIPLILASTLAGVNVLGDNLAYQLLITAMVPLSTALPFFLYLKTGQRDVSDFLRFEKVGFFTGLLCVLAGLAVCLLGNYPAWIIQELLGNIGYEPAQDLFQNQQTIGFFVLEFLSTAVLVPVMEEFAFRGVLFSVLRKHGTGFAIVASALVFSLVHLDFSNVLFALVAGLVFGFLYARTGNLWVTICIHALNNGIAVVGSYEELLFGNMAETADFLLLIIPLCVGLLALVLLLIFRRKPLFGRREKQLPIQPLGGGESAGAIVRAPLFWILVAMMALYTVSLFF